MVFIREFKLTEWKKMKLEERRIGLTVTFLHSTLPDEIFIAPTKYREKEARKSKREEKTLRSIMVLEMCISLHPKFKEYLL